MTARPVRMLEVAAAAGVSRATVSLVMRDDPSIPEATRERVLRAARDIGYVYDRRAARLRSQTSNVVGLVVTDNANPFFAEFAEALESRLHAQGQTILLGFTHDDLDRQHSVVQRLVEDRVAGIVLVPAIGTTSASLADAVSATSVVLATRPMDVPGASYVGTTMSMVVGWLGSTSSTMECARWPFSEVLAALPLDGQDPLVFQRLRQKQVSRLTLIGTWTPIQAPKLPSIWLRNSFGRC